MSYESWQYDVWDNLGLDKAASTAAEVGGEVVAFSLVKRDGDRMWSDYTGSVPAYRGRGLARLAKTAALHRAAADGCTRRVHVERRGERADAGDQRPAGLPAGRSPVVLPGRPELTSGRPAAGPQALPQSRYGLRSSRARRVAARRGALPRSSG